MTIAVDILSEIAGDLEHHPESLRIKKMIFCLCKKQWINDVNLLNQIPFQDLIQAIHQLYPSLENLQDAIHKLVKTINRQHIYSPLAEIIVSKLGQIYQEKMSDATLILSAEPIVSVTQEPFYPDTLITSIANSLSNHKEASRIKKLMFSVCKNRWEGNQTLIDQYDFQELILELRNLYFTQTQLQASFNKIVQNINKQNLYTCIAQIIIGQLEILYSGNSVSSQDDPRQTQIFNTQIIQINNPSITVAANPPLVRQDSIDTMLVDLEAEQPIITELKQVQQVPVEKIKKKIDPFELRLEILQYTNPLRAKMLLFSLLHNTFDRGENDWSILRGYALDDLLAQLIDTCHNVADLESQLYNTAQSMQDSDSNLQAASTILEVLKPIYDKTKA